MKMVKCKILYCLFYILPFSFYFVSAQEASLALPIGHTSPIATAVYSPDGKYIVTASWDNTAKLWQANDGRLLMEMRGHSGSLNSAAFSRDGKYIITSSKDSTARIWQASDGRQVAALHGHLDWVSAAVFSPDGKTVVTASWDNTARVWDISGNLKGELKGHSAPLSAVSFSPDGKNILTASKDSTAIIWRTADRTILFRIKHREWVSAALYSADGKHIATSSYDGTAALWNAVSGQRIFELKGHDGPVNSAAFSRDGKFVVTASVDQTARTWSVADGKQRLVLEGHSGPVNAVDFSDDGKFIATASADSTARIWLATSGQLISELKGHTGLVSSALFGRDGKHILTASWDNTAKIWQPASAVLLAELKGHVSVVQSAAFSADGRYLITSSWDNTAKMWHSSNGHLLAELKGHGSWVNGSAFSPDGNFILTASTDNTAIIWRRYAGDLFVQLKGHTDIVNSAVYNVSGDQIVTSSWDSTARVWRASDGQLLFTLKGHSNVVGSATFSPDGKYIATSSWDNSARIWSSANGQLIAELKGHTDKVRSAVFSPDGSRLITSSWDNTARIWQSADGKFLNELSGHSASLNTAIFSPDGKYILTASLDHSAKLWDGVDGHFIRAFNGHTNGIINAVFSPDGKYMATASWDNTGRIWETSTGKSLSILAGHKGALNTIAYSPDGAYIVTTSEDNTLKKWNGQTGEFLYTFFAVDNTDYLAIDKDGHYDGSEAARKMLYYVCENEIVDLEQLKDLAWEPGLVSKIMGVNKEPITAKKIAAINICNYTPVVREKGFSNGSYHYQVTPKKGGIGEVQLYVNGKLVEKYKPATLPRSGTGYQLSVSRQKIVGYCIPGVSNQVFATATTNDGAMVARGATQIAAVDRNKAAAPPDMYIISIGISDYKSDKLKLRYASKDAMDFSSVVAASAAKLLNTNGKEHVHLYNFNTEPGSQRWPSKAAIQKLADSIARSATSDDIVVAFFAGHGVLQSGQKNFYLLTAEATNFDLAGVESDVAISTDELKDWLRKIKANKQIMIIDACNSGQVINTLQQLANKRDVPADQQRALESLKDKTGTYILSASASGQSAYETSLYGQGLLTYSLLYGIKLGAGLRNNKFIDLTKWFNFASENVKILARDIGGRQDPQIIGNASFEIGLVDQQIVDNIKLSIKKKIFRNSTFIQDIDLLNDDLSLSELTDKELISLSDRGKESPLAFVSGNALPDAWSIRGKYTLEQNDIVMKVSVFRGQKEKVYQFDLKGAVDKKEDLARKIVEKVQALLKVELITATK